MIKLDTIKPYIAQKAQAGLDYAAKKASELRKIALAPENRNYLYATGASAATLGVLTAGFFKFSRSIEKSFYSESAKLSKKPVEINPDLDGKIEEVEITTNDNIDLKCWDINPENVDRYAIVCHGNCLNIGDYQELYSELLSKGIAVFALEYRGYNGNKGQISEEGLYKDADAALEYLREKGIEDKNIGVIGHSLGGAIACNLAHKNNLGFLVLDSTFNNAKSSIKGIINHKDVREPLSVAKKALISSIPISMIPIKDQYKSDEKIKTITSPILIVHCKGDDVIPYSLAKDLASKAQQAEYLEFATLGNSSIHNLTSEENMVIAEFISNKVFKEPIVNSSEKIEDCSEAA